jgi:hypothetical protein
VDFGVVDQLLMTHSEFIRYGREKWKLIGTAHDQLVNKFGGGIAQYSHFYGIPMQEVGLITL